MKLIKQTRRIKCDVGGCKNLAEYTLSKEGANPKGNVNLCKECMQSMYSLFSQELVPESPTNILNAKGKRSVKK
ncbi:MAG: hypothetical protein IKC83_04245 [Clostridia bacterium]|nr:hypothetical protein [Clostridia bacterium]